MKKLYCAICIMLATMVFAQEFSLPPASPRQKIEQQFSISKITIDYGRPGVKGRKIFGELVPYGKVWRAGANTSTKISFGQSLNFGGKYIASGTYALFVIPTEKEWKVILNKDAQQWGAYDYDEKLNVLEITVPVKQSNVKQEYFDISFNPVNESDMNLVFKWDNIIVEIPLKSGKPETVAKITEKLKEIKQIESAAAKEQ